MFVRVRIRFTKYFEDGEGGGKEVVFLFIMNLKVIYYVYYVDSIDFVDTTIVMHEYQT